MDLKKEKKEASNEVSNENLYQDQENLLKDISTIIVGAITAYKLIILLKNGKLF